MKCPYNPEMDCQHIDTSGMNQTIPCIECAYYELGIRPTGGCFTLTAVILIIAAVAIITYFLVYRT